MARHTLLASLACLLLSCGGNTSSPFGPDGGLSVDTAVACYSPTSNLSSAYQVDAVGCACDPAVDKDVCAHDGSAGAVALLCRDAQWQAVYDGPCMPPSPDAGHPVDTAATCYAPTTNLSSVYQVGAVGCACDPAVDNDVCVRDDSAGEVALVCRDAQWLAVIDGPCMPGLDAGHALDATGTCYSPTANLSSAYRAGAVGCACDPAVDKDVCASGGVLVGAVALLCRNGQWQAVYDGPCGGPVGG